MKSCRRTPLYRAQVRLPSCFSLYSRFAPCGLIEASGWIDIILAISAFQDGVVFNERQFDPQIVPQLVEGLIKKLDEASTTTRPVFADRSLYVALRDEALPDLIAVNEVLGPFITPLFRLAARGHWLREHRPVRIPTQFCTDGPLIPPQTKGIFCLTTSLDTGGDLRIVVAMDGRGVRYALRPYPEIQEFAAMLHHLKAERPWSGAHFHACAERPSSENPARFHFCRPADQVRLSFDQEEWDCLKELFSSALAAPSLRPVLSALILEYGEL